MEKNNEIPSEERILRAIFGEAPSSPPKKAVNPQGYSRLKEKLSDVFGSLSERERKVVEQRFGLCEGHSKTLEEIGKQFKVTRERIRQIEAKALRKMRHPARKKQLEEFLGKPEVDS